MPDRIVRRRTRRNARRAVPSALLDSAGRSITPHLDLGHALPVNLGALRVLAEGDTELQREIIALFVENADRALRDIARALANDDLAAIVSGAGLIKRVSRQAQAVPVLRTAELLQSAARSEPTETVRSLVSRLQQEFARAVEYTRAWAT